MPGRIRRLFEALQPWFIGISAVLCGGLSVIWSLYDGSQFLSDLGRTLIRTVAAFIHGVFFVLFIGAFFQMHNSGKTDLTSAHEEEISQLLETVDQIQADMTEYIEKATVRSVAMPQYMTIHTFISWSFS